MLFSFGWIIMKNLSCASGGELFGADFLRRQNVLFNTRCKIISKFVMKVNVMNQSADVIWGFFYNFQSHFKTKQLTD